MSGEITDLLLCANDDMTREQVQIIRPSPTYKDMVVNPSGSPSRAVINTSNSSVFVPDSEVANPNVFEHPLREADTVSLSQATGAVPKILNKYPPPIPPKSRNFNTNNNASNQQPIETIVLDDSEVAEAVEGPMDIVTSPTPEGPFRLTLHPWSGIATHDELYRNIQRKRSSSQTSVIPMTKGLIPLTTGGVRTSFVTLCQCVPGHKDRPTWALSNFIKDGQSVFILWKKTIELQSRPNICSGSSNEPEQGKISDPVASEPSCFSASYQDKEQSQVEEQKVFQNPCYASVSFFMLRDDVVVLLDHFCRSSRLAIAVQKNIKTDQENLPINLRKHWVLLFFSLEGQGQIRGICMNLMSSEFMKRVEYRNGSWIFSKKL
ncbi:unnamed protein product [Lepeophtheirus salmonis]|uniref:(salmon louse) hypothetical protein n=1 Tax=Lepeophtheirus salmonis TaxID=72036 RepID=A0A7R8CML0_LEPSM|nr:unnamed protein product [Lepeophtheirus salmonis]CAF2864128.1 unnamed protein product [Lepeophtheirus salmonis]